MKKKFTMKKIIVLTFVVCSTLLLLSFVVTLKALNSNDMAFIMQSDVEALSQTESGDIYYQSMGYCNGVLTYKCIKSYTAERCRIYVCKE